MHTLHVASELKEFFNYQHVSLRTRLRRLITKDVRKQIFEDLDFKNFDIFHVKNITL